MDRYQLAVVIPAYNECDTIFRIVSSVIQYGVVIVVDDGSTDRTAQIARDAGAEVVCHDTNLGYDAALSSGFVYASTNRYNFVLTMDADGQHHPNLLPVFINELRNGADVVVGVRDRRQRISEVLFSFVSGLLWGIRDPLCGMKAYRIDLYNELGHFDSYGSIGTELAIYAARQGKKIVQIPVVTRDRIDTPRFGRKISANWRIIKALYHTF
jgi:glycosyltransferase involved in cell wall biosynthesis